MLQKSVAVRLFAVFLTAGLVLSTGLVAASALSGSVEDPVVVSVDDCGEDTVPADGSESGADGDDSDAQSGSGDESDAQGRPDGECLPDGAADNPDGDSDSSDSDAGTADDSSGDDSGDEPSPAGESVGSAQDNHGASISHLARTTPPGPEHGAVVCAAASRGKCRPDHGTEDAGTEDAGTEDAGTEDAEAEDAGTDDPDTGGADGSDGPPEGRGRPAWAGAGRAPHAGR